MQIAVIGGGVYGTAISYFLTELASVDVTLFEKKSLASASTGKSAGIVRHHYSDEIQIRFAKRGREILEELPERIGNDGGFHQNGYLISAGEADEASFRENIRTQQSVGLDVDLLDLDEVEEYVPEISTEDMAVAAIEHESGFADPYLVATGFAEQAGKQGADVRTNTPVTDIQTEGGEAVAITTPEGEMTVDYVVDAAGPWAANVAAMAGINLPLERYEAKVATLSVPTEFGPDRPTISDIETGLYAKPEISGNFIAGGVEREGGHQPISGRAELEGMTTSDLCELGRLVEHRLPGYADARVTETWSELITAPPDWHQIIGVPKGYENVYVVAGGSGHGFKESAGFSESIAQEILGRTSRISLDDYRLKRFERSKTFSSGYGDGSRS